MFESGRDLSHGQILLLVATDAKKKYNVLAIIRCLLVDTKFFASFFQYASRIRDDWWIALQNEIDMTYFNQR